MPSLDRVLLRKSVDGTFTEVGTLTERVKGKTYKLVLPDGSQVEHEVGADEAMVDRDSMNHRLRVDPAAVEEQLRNSPHSIFRQLLGEAPRGAKASELKGKLYGLDRKLVDRGWDRAKKVLDASEDVKRSDAKVPTYTLLTDGPAIGEARARPADSETSTATSGELEAVEHGPRDARTLGADIDPQHPTDVPPVPSDVAPTHVSTDPLVDLLARRGLIELDVDLEWLVHRPLFLGQAVSRMKRAELAEAMATLEHRHHVLIATVLGPATEQLRSEVERLPKDMYEDALRAGAGEINRADSASARQLSLLGALVERATRSRSIEPAVLVGVANTFATVARKTGQRREHEPAARVGVEQSREARAGLDSSLEAIARHESFTSGPRPEITWSDVARAATQAEFARTGGRSLLVSVLFRQSPEAARDLMWWDNATFDQLADAGYGPLSVALEDDVIARRVVRPLVEVAVRDIETRARLAHVMSAAAPVARWVSGNDVKAALLRTGKTDSAASAWAEVLTDTRELARMERALSEARAEMVSSAAAQQELQQQIAHLESRLVITGQELAAARGAQGDARGAHDRQVKLDIARVLAKLAAQVSQSPSASRDAGLMRSISHATAREGLDPIADVGKRATFDPRIHDPMGLSFSPDTQVTVVRPGYTWRDGIESVVLVKAQVVPNGE